MHCHHIFSDTECIITDVVPDQYVECTVPAGSQSSASRQAGNRGVTFEYWTSTTRANIDDVWSLTSSDPGYVASSLDETYHEDVNDTMDNYVSKMTTYFSPPHTGQYQFQLKGDDKAKLFVDGVSCLLFVMSFHVNVMSYLLFTYSGRQDDVFQKAAEVCLFFQT